mgnify:CR=1 FL=1
MAFLSLFCPFFRESTVNPPYYLPEHSATGHRPSANFSGAGMLCLSLPPIGLVDPVQVPSLTGDLMGLGTCAGPTWRAPIAPGRPAQRGRYVLFATSAHERRAPCRSSCAQEDLQEAPSRAHTPVSRPRGGGPRRATSSCRRTHILPPRNCFSLFLVRC